MGNPHGNSDRLHFLGLQNHCRWWLQPWNSKMLASWKKSYGQPRQHIKNQRHYFANKDPSMVFPVVMYGCESWTIKKAEHWRIDAFELTGWSLCSPRDSQESSLTSQIQKYQFFSTQLLYGSNLTSIHDYWKNHSFDYTDFCQQSDVSAF